MQSTDRRAIFWGEAPAEVTYAADHGYVAVVDVAGDLDRNLPDG